MSLYDIFPVKEVSGDIVTFEDGADGIPMESIIASIYPIQSGSGDPSPENIRPISGRTGLNVYRTGFNLCQDSVHINHFWENSVLKKNKNANYAAIDIKIPVVPGEDYCVYVPDNTSGGVMYVSFFDASESLIARESYSIESTNVFTTTADTRFIAIGFYKSGGVSVGERICVSLSGENDGTYEPYQGTTYAFDWSTQAGTVYGGTLDVVTGALSSEYANIASYNGETITEPWLSSMDEYTPGATPTTGAQVVYKLATPITYQLTPQEVATLVGKNTVFADVAPITVEYHSHTQTGVKQIDGLFVDGIDMQADGWFLKWRKLAAPKPKTDYVSVWGRDGDIDLTESGADGQVFYENRDLTMDMVYIGDNWTQAYSELLDKLHGKDCMVQFTSDPYWYWSGRIVASLYEHKPHSLSMDGSVFPYKLSIIKTTASTTVNGVTEGNAVDVVLPGSRMRVSPKVTVTAGTGESVTLKWGSKTQTLSAGTYYVRGLKVGREDVIVKVYGTGTVDFEYRKGML